ncbi:efflux RND transporter periplasmic adaptor subunit [Denitromonas iodatirespirans]|uniref:HlyD family efflux transporter periplasmic adaptor subunit n=1 Tax=Denitromonas iodatirespirans TaxID=2795389 RepID=A0A944DEC4_DENI1|nr:HlyD family efflux transporter periplasmic adaptor subunit [Denitromonas iodatirespirans]MBT0963451.1 HlyD family efflux transporter periplasmic adaptor subunit [Denitromonas iodatirespirans]
MSQPSHPEYAGETAILLHLLQLGRRARAATSAAELGFIAVNETKALLPYRQAALWLADGGVDTLSGVSAVEANTPYVQWLERVARRLRDTSPAVPQVLTAASLADDDAAQWAEWWPAHAVWLPLPAPGNGVSPGAWLFARDTPWREGEVVLLAEWCAQWTQSWLLWAPKGRRRLSRSVHETQPPTGLRALLHPPAWREQVLACWQRPARRWSLLAALALFIPVRLTVLAPAELVPAQPAVIRAPLDGIVDRVLVQPNQTVTAGTPLFEFDRTTLQSRLLVAEQALATAEAEYRQFAQQAVFDSKSKAQIATLQGHIAVKRAEVALVRDLNTRAAVTAPQDGVVLFDDPNEWVGRPVSTGERVMMVAAPGDVEVEAWLSPADLIDFPDAAALTLYLNAQPFSPVDARVRHIAHEALIRPEGGYAYRLRAELVPGEAVPRVGLKGSARIAGERVPFVYWALRKPLAALRAFIGY